MSAGPSEVEKFIIGLDIQRQDQDMPDTRLRVTVTLDAVPAFILTELVKLYGGTNSGFAADVLEAALRDAWQVAGQPSRFQDHPAWEAFLLASHAVEDAARVVAAQSRKKAM